MTYYFILTQDLLGYNGNVYAEKPQKDIHSFVGTFTVLEEGVSTQDGLGIENTLWANTVIASGEFECLVSSVIDSIRPNALL